MQDYLFCGNRIKRQQPKEKSPFRKKKLNTDRSIQFSAYQIT